jgi:hypothetical protein
MITYNWKITALKKAPTLDGLSDVITGINFKYTGTNEDGISDSFAGACPIGAPTSKSFTAIAELTEAEVIEWAKANHPVSHMQEVISKGIENKITPKSEDVTEVDWLKTEAESAEPEAGAEPVAE